MKITEISQQQRGINENQKLGSFYDRVVEYGPGIGCCAAGAAVVYWLNAPIVGAIGIGIGGILICKRLFARPVAVANPVPNSVPNPLMNNLEEIKSSHRREIEESIESFIKAFDNTSAQNQVAIIKTMTSMLYDDVKEDAMKVLMTIKYLINEERLNEVDSFEAFEALVDGLKLYEAHTSQALVDGCIAFFEKIASEDAEKDKSEVLHVTLHALHRFLVIKKAFDIENKKQQINLSQLNASLDNLTLRFIPEYLVSSLKNMESPNPMTRVSFFNYLR